MYKTLLRKEFSQRVDQKLHRWERQTKLEELEKESNQVKMPSIATKINQLRSLETKKYPRMKAQKMLEFSCQWKLTNSL